MSNINDDLINHNKQQYNSLKEEMETTYQQFLKYTTEFVEDWYKKTPEFYVKSNPMLTLQLGTEKLITMKQSIKDLVENAKNKVNEHLSDKKMWPHFSDDNFNSDFYHSSGASIPNVVNKKIRYILGELGAILYKFGYIALSHNGLGSKSIEVWCEENSDDRYRSNTVPYYTGKVDFSFNMNNKMSHYINLYKKSYSLMDDIVKLEQKKIKAAATELWDSI